ncbi:hypothetical protein MON38_10640 [Hymenobacter sp. DH14]|uniref:Phage tail tape measure protein n=1 Tax=Hymenobacter cyanobacteriorum TaxID=2926463 RepID=A0A9X1VGT0_9BACT|nr:hypothetical protein [Hymenobacter cyanobacteriorum]MCI1187878.1 hypothetical protein [Hymenobacter cyanobacteriorum]
MAADNQIILQVKLDEGKTLEQLQALVLEIEATKKAQVDLSAAKKAGAVTEQEYSKQVVDLRLQLKGQQVEQTNLTKNLDLYRTATGELGNTYKGTQAQLSLAQRQYQVLQESQNGSTESTKVLSETIANLRSTLAKTDEQQGLFVRNIGNYPKGESLEPLIQQLVHLQEVQKQLPAGSQAAAEAQKQIGFQFGKLNESAASAGLTQTALNNKLQDYGERLRPATTELAKLTIAQDEVARSAGKESEEFAKIGFQIGATRKAISAVPPELAKVPTAADTAKKSLFDAANSTGIWGQSIGKAQQFLAPFRTGLDVLKGAFKGVKEGEEAAAEGTKVLKIGLAEIGIGLIILALTTLVSYFTQSAEGMKIIKGLTSGLGAAFQVLTDIVTGTGRAIALVFQGDFKGAAKQLGDQFTGVGAKIANAAKEGYSLVGAEKELIKARRELEIADVREQSRVNVLLRLSKDRSKSATEQLAALKEAGEIEARLTAAQITQQEKELDLIERKIKLKGSGAKGDLLQEEADKKKQIAETLAAQDETNAKIQVRESVFRQKLAADRLAAQKAAAAAQAQAVQDEIKNRITQTETALLSVKTGSEKELQLREKLVHQQAELEAATEKKTAADRALIRAKSLVEIEKLEEEFQQKQQDNARKFLDDQLKNDQQAIANEKRVREERKAETVSAYTRDLAVLERSLDARRLAIETDYAEGRASKKQYEAGLNVIEQGGFAARLVLAKHHNQDVTKAEKELTRALNSELLKRTEKENAEYQQRLDVASAFGQEIGSLFAQTLNDTGASLEDFAAKVLILILDSLEKAVLAAQAETVANAIAKGGVYGIIEAAAEVALITAAFEGAKAIISKPSSKQFAEGTVLGGPSHANGGIQLFSPSGHHYGEAEGGEIIMTKGVWNNPLLRPLASTLNVLGGGAPLMPRVHMAVGGVTATQSAGYLRGDSMIVDPKALGQAVAAALSKTRIETKVSNIKRGLAKDAYNNSISSF